MKVKLDFGGLALSLRDAYLRECLAGTCGCVTIEEHEENIKKAKELGLTAR